MSLPVYAFASRYKRVIHCKYCYYCVRATGHAESYTPVFDKNEIRSDGAEGICRFNKKGIWNGKIKPLSLAYSYLLKLINSPWLCQKPFSDHGLPIKAHVERRRQGKPSIEFLTPNWHLIYYYFKNVFRLVRACTRYSRCMWMAVFSAQLNLHMPHAIQAIKYKIFKLNLVFITIFVVWEVDLLKVNMY